MPTWLIILLIVLAVIAAGIVLFVLLRWIFGRRKKNSGQVSGQVRYTDGGNTARVVLPTTYRKV